MQELERALKEGEHLLWTGRPEPYKILDKTNTPAFVQRCLICAIICLGLEILYVRTMLASGTGIKWGVMAVFFVICASVPVLFLFHSRRVRKFVYAATDQRLLIVSDQVREMAYERIPECALKTDKDGHTTVLCGKKAIAAKPGRWRKLTYCVDPNDNGVATGTKFGFYAVDEPDELRRVLSGRVRLV